MDQAMSESWKLDIQYASTHLPFCLHDSQFRLSVVLLSSTTTTTHAVFKAPVIVHRYFCSDNAVGVFRVSLHLFVYYSS